MHGNQKRLATHHDTYTPMLYTVIQAILTHFSMVS
jgi:hypothetical protein